MVLLIWSEPASKWDILCSDTKVTGCFRVVESSRLRFGLSPLNIRPSGKVIIGTVSSYLARKSNNPSILQNLIVFLPLPNLPFWF